MKLTLLITILPDSAFRFFFFIEYLVLEKSAFEIVELSDVL